MPYKIIENEQEKVLASTKYNYYFNKSNGFFARWGDTKENDPNFSFFGPEIADIEIVDICHGIRNKEGKRKVCEFCYKANTPNNTGIMTLETFKKIFHLLTVVFHYFVFYKMFITKPVAFAWLP